MCPAIVLSKANSRSSLEFSFYDINLFTRLSSNDVRKLGFVHNLASKPPNLQAKHRLSALSLNLEQAYATYYDFPDVSFSGLNGKLLFYRKLTYYDVILRTRCSFSLGSFIPINAAEGTAYAKVRAILVHKWAGQYQIFMALDWLQDRPPHPIYQGPVRRMSLKTSKKDVGDLMGSGIVRSQLSPHAIPLNAKSQANSSEQFFLINEGVIRLI